MSQSQAHIAGIGISSGTQQDISNLAISAGAKALLDAGITYAKVRLSIACSLEEAQLSIPQACLKAFGRQKAPVCVVDSQSALFTAVQCVRSGQIDCAMVVGLDMVSRFRFSVSAIADFASRNARASMESR
jgi:sterol carrier protein 2